MTRCLSILSLALALGLSFAASAQQLNPQDPYYQISKISVREIGASKDISTTHSRPNKLMMDKIQGVSDLEQIINIGQRLWQIIDDGCPVMNISSQVATALPSSVRSMTELVGWKAPLSRTYEVSMENAYGMTVVSFAYRLVAVSGGSLDGVGKYVGYAAIQPEDVYVAWGFVFNATANAVSTYNSGTKENPIGALNLVIDYTITSPLTDIRQSQSYYITGAGEISQLN